MAAPPFLEVKLARVNDEDGTKILARFYRLDPAKTITHNLAGEEIAIPARVLLCEQFISVPQQLNRGQIASTVNNLFTEIAGRYRMSAARGDRVDAA